MGNPKRHECLNYHFNHKMVSYRENYYNLSRLLLQYLLSKKNTGYHQKHSIFLSNIKRKTALLSIYNTIVHYHHYIKNKV